MRPTVSSDESISVDRSAHVARYADHSSRHPKEQISASKNAQTEYGTHLSQNATSLDQRTAYREQHVNNIEEDQQTVTRNSEKTEQKHKGVDTRNINSSRRHRSKSCVKLRLWCLRLCRTKKRYSKRVLRNSRQFLGRIKARSKECEEPDDVVAGVSTAPHRESISHRDAPKKSRSRKRDEPVEVADRDISEDTKEKRKEWRRREKEERRRKVLTEEERRQRRERRKLEEHVPHPVDTRLVAHDDDLVAEDRVVPVKPPSSIAEFAKSCCYLCAQNTLAIAAAAAAVVPKPEQSDKCVQVSAHKFHAETSPTLDKSCSPLLLVRTVQSSVKVRTRETGTLCPGASAVPRGEMGPRDAKKRKKFTVFPGLTRTKCPAGRHAACETDKSTARRDDNAEKREPRSERCCKEKNA